VSALQTEAGDAVAVVTSFRRKYSIHIGILSVCVYVYFLREDAIPTSVKKTKMAESQRLQCDLAYSLHQKFIIFPRRVTGVDGMPTINFAKIDQIIWRYVAYKQRLSVLS